MYITINNIIGEKTINRSYSIRNFNSGKEITVVSMFSDNIQYEMIKPFWLKLMGGGKKQVLNKTYTRRELNAVVERKLILTDLNNDSRIIKTNKLAKITDMIFNLDGLDNSDNLEDGISNNTLFTYYESSFEDFTRFEPKTPQCKKLKNGMIVSLSLKITDQNNNMITNGPGTTVVLHIR